MTLALAILLNRWFRERYCNTVLPRFHRHHLKLYRELKQQRCNRQGCQGGLPLGVRCRHQGKGTDDLGPSRRQEGRSFLPTKTWSWGWEYSRRLCGVQSLLRRIKCLGYVQSKLDDKTFISSLNDGIQEQQRSKMTPAFALWLRLVSNNVRSLTNLFFSACNGDHEYI